MEFFGKLRRGWLESFLRLRRLAINLIKSEEQYYDWAIKKRRLAASLDPFPSVSVRGQDQEKQRERH